VTFLWIAAGSHELSSSARRILADAENQLFLSAASVWEITVKASLGKLSLPVRADRFIAEVRRLRSIQTLPLSEAAVSHLIELPMHHRDPFDRMLVCQALEHRFPIITPDSKIARYPITVIW
jgi:PIN domain nuclease of toxin-antitoxin system